jgi:hypothetical protein
MQQTPDEVYLVLAAFVATPVKFSLQLDFGE